MVTSQSDLNQVYLFEPGDCNDFLESTNFSLFMGQFAESKADEVAQLTAYVNEVVLPKCEELHLDLAERAPHYDHIQPVASLGTIGMVDGELVYRTPGRLGSRDNGELLRPEVNGAKGGKFDQVGTGISVKPRDDEEADDRDMGEPDHDQRGDSEAWLPAKKPKT